jgi:hypothetical protein
VGGMLEEERIGGQLYKYGRGVIEWARLRRSHHHTTALVSRNIFHFLFSDKLLVTEIR